jgi:hypothetical protein
MARRRPMRRTNGVSAYHVYLGQLLKKAKLKGKSKKARKAAFKKAISSAMAMAKTGFPASLSAGVKAKNKKISAAKVQRRARRGGLKKAAYKALSPAERRKLRRASGGASAAPSRRRRASAKKPASAASAKGTRMVRTKSGRIMYFVNNKLASKAAYEAAVGKSASRPASASKAPKKAPSRKRRTSKKAASAPKAASRKAASKKGGRKSASKKGARRARKNPSFGGFMDTVKAFGREALTVQGLGGAAAVGVAHGFVAPMVAEYLAGMFPQSYRVPVLDVEVSASSFAFTATGLVAGAALAGIGYLAGRPMLGLGLGGLAFSSGLVIDTVGLVQSRGEQGSLGAIDNDGVVYGDVAYGAIDNDGVVYGDVAYGDVAYGDVAYGDVAYGGVMGGPGMDYGAACMSEYADAETADAEDSGADFSAEEGQALMDGPLAFLRRFGRAPRRMTGVRGAKSRHAGRAGHRWGWLIKLVGMDRAAKIAALSPEKRLKVIAALRKQALDSLSTLMAEQAATTTSEHLLLPQGPARPNLLPAPQAMGLDLMALGSGGAMGAGGYGSVVYAGSGF